MTTEELQIIISAQIQDLTKKLDKAQKETKEFEKKGSKSFKEFSETTSKVSKTVTVAVAAIGAAVVAGATQLLGLVDSTKEYRQEQAKLVTAFETVGSSATQAKTTYNDLYRVLGDSGKATEAANHLAKLTTEEKSLAEYTKICQGVYATFGDSIATEGLTEAINHTAKLGEVQGTLADALEWSGVNVDDFNAQLFWCNTESEREALIRSTLTDLYGEAAEGYEQNAASILQANEAQASLDERLASIGETLEPVKTKLTEMGASIAEKLLPVIQDFIENHGAQIEEVLLSIADAIGSVIKWIVDNWDILSVLATVIGAIVAILTVFSTVMTIVNAVMAASPVTWIVLAIVAAIAALVAIIILVIKYWDEIAAAGVAAWEWLKGVFSTIASWINEKVIQPVKNFFVKLWSDIKAIFAKVGSWFGDVFSGAWNGIKNAFSKVTGFFKGIWDSIKSIFSKVGSTIGSAITNTVKKAINSVLSTAVKIINGFISAINFAIGIINKIPGVNITKLDKLQVPQLARGGVVDSATMAVIGEQGTEAVVPLENNLEWLDKLATMLTERLGGAGGSNQPIYLMVDKKVLAETSIRGINDITRQTGSMPLVLV